MSIMILNFVDKLPFVLLFDHGTNITGVLTTTPYEMFFSQLLRNTLFDFPKLEVINKNSLFQAK